MQNRLLLILFTFYLTISAQLSPILSANANNKKLTTIVILGDSLTEGYGIKKELAYPTLVEKKLIAEGLNIKIINAGISGSTSASAASRLNWFIKSKPDILLLALGANDGLRGVDIRATKKNLKDTIHRAKENNIRVWLAGMKMPPNYGISYTQQFEKMFTDVASEEKVAFLPFLLEGVAAQTRFNQTDGIHPNEKGHEVIAEVVAKFIRKNL
jgi:acyl-CoA thioesterase I